MNRDLFSKAVVEGIETHFDDPMKAEFVHAVCDFICNDPNDSWAEVIDDHGFKVFINNVHQINVIFDGSLLRFLLTQDTFDIERTDFESEFKDFGTACLFVVSFYDAFMKHAAEVLNEKVKKQKSKNNNYSAWPV